MQTQLALPDRRSGKVRDLYNLQFGAEQAVLIIATDRISAGDVVMANGVPGRGRLLTRLATFWFRKLQGLAPHHLLSTDADQVPGLSGAEKQLLRDRVMICRRTEVIPVECIVRAYLTGSAWSDYVASGEVSGIRLPPGLRQCEKLPEPVFTLSTKASSGHDENISYQTGVEQLGEPLMERLRALSLAIYRQAADHAAQRGLLIADTKFEFGQLPDGQLLLIDELLTPDSSRFWSADDYQAGREQQGFDKQHLRNYLYGEIAAGRWDGTEPGPVLPDQLIQELLARYEVVLHRLV